MTDKETVNETELHLFRKGKKSAMSVFVDFEYFSVHARKYYQMFFARYNL